MHVCVVKDDCFILITYAINGKVVWILTVTLIVALSNKNLPLAWFTKHNHSPSEQIITRTDDASECDAENGMVGLILQRLHPNLNRKHMVCACMCSESMVCAIYIMHMYVLLDNGLTVIPCAVQGKGGMILILALTIAISKKNMHLAWCTKTRPLNKLLKLALSIAQKMVWYG